MHMDFKTKIFRQPVLVFTGMPLLIWSVGNYPERSWLKESLSVMMILVFCQMVSLFFWSRSNAVAVKDLKMGRIIKIHKAVGYTCVAFMLLHSVFLVVPRLFEAGVLPGAAFLNVITTFNRRILLGMLAWSLLLTIGLSAFARNRLPMTYKTWRKFHGILAVLCVTAAAWHMINLGRHSNLALSMLIILLTAGGVGLLLKSTSPAKSELTRTDR